MIANHIAAKTNISDFKTKDEFRNEFKTRIENFSASQILLESRRICEILDKFDEVAQKKHLAAYAAHKNELDVSDFAQKFIHRDGFVYYPRFNAETKSYEMARVTDFKKDFLIGKYGIPEPRKSLSRINDRVRFEELVWLVPGLAFDKLGYRLGRGKGYYDRLLRDSRGIKIGIAFDWQIVDRLPVERHDVPVQFLITPQWSLCCEKN